MNSFVVISIFAAAATFQMVAALDVTVFYESRCSDSVRFIRRQLYPTYQALQKYMNVQFVPFGKAYYTTFPWSISCQHGPTECFGNAIQACALARYKDAAQQMNFVNCIMGEKNPHTAGSKCAKKLNYNYNGIEECATNAEGQYLMMQHGDRTRNLGGILTFVPTILFDNKYNKRDQYDALRDLKSVVCRKIQPRPAECRGY